MLDIDLRFQACRALKALRVGHIHVEILCAGQDGALRAIVRPGSNFLAPTAIVHEPDISGSLTTFFQVDLMGVHVQWRAN